eukprot:2332212-Alexandrium_andersonii.AAC.1
MAPRQETGGQSVLASAQHSRGGTNSILKRSAPVIESEVRRRIRGKTTPHSIQGFPPNTVGPPSPSARPETHLGVASI